MTESPTLDYLVSAYLNEDVFDFYPDVLAAVDDFVKQDPKDVAPLAAEIEHVLRAHSDQEIDQLLTGYGIGFVPGDLGYRGWLARIADRVKATAS